MSLLPDADRFRRLVDGSARGVAPRLARAGLAGLALPYGLAVAARNAAYDRGWLPTHRAAVPVLCVGNLTLGGTGKTPLVAWLARLARAHGIEPAIVSRGYAAARGGTSDEAAELAVVLGGILHVANRDRVAGVATAVERGATATILDDGFQHRRLARDLDIVAIDATDPFGCGHLVPRGLLREPLGGLRRAGAVVLTRASSVDARRREAIRSSLRTACGDRVPVVWAEADHAPARLRDISGALWPLERLAGARVVACAAIGNPAAFRRTLDAVGADVARFRAFADHHAYGGGDIDRLAQTADDVGADLIVTTVKDLVKLRRTEVGGRPLVALEIELEITQGRGDLERLVLDVLAAARGSGEVHPSGT
jgi:tetraacyldisaccharide 4'-kinase